MVSFDSFVYITIVFLSKLNRVIWKDVIIWHLSNTINHINEGFNDDDGESEYIKFMLPKKILNTLRNEAKEKQIDVNTLANQVFDSYANYLNSATKTNMLDVPKEVLVQLLEGYSEDQIKGIAVRVLNKIREDLPLMQHGEHNFKAVMDLYEYWLKIGGVPYRHIIEDDNENDSKRHTFIVQFNMSRKYSLFAAECWKAYFEPVVTKKIECSITDSSVAITVEGK